MIVANAAAPAAKAATATIPIVFVSGTDPVAVGLVASLNRPGGNLTGVSQLNVQLGPKRLELLHETIPAATSIALLMNPASPGAETLSREALSAAQTLGLRLHVSRASTDHELDAVFAEPAELRVGGLMIGPDSFFTSRIGTSPRDSAAVYLIYEFRRFAGGGEPGPERRLLSPGRHLCPREFEGRGRLTCWSCGQPVSNWWSI